MAAISAILAQAVYAQPPSPARSAPLKVRDVPVADILQRLGAKLEQGSEAREIDGYSSHFDRMDTNRDGKHTRAEYVDKGGYMTPQARAGIFRAADGNADGVVTKAEYVLNRIITDEAKAIVQAMDDDEDGLVERAEFVKHAAKLLSDRDLAEQVFAALDVNADGGIPIPEYLRVWGQWARAGRKSADQRIAARRSVEGKVQQAPENCPACAMGLTAEFVFNRLDVNEDKIVTVTEFRRSPGMDDEEKAGEAVSRIDKDGNGTLTWEEFETAYKARHANCKKPAPAAIAADAVKVRSDGRGDGSRFARVFIMRSDKDGDGRIGKSEFRGSDSGFERMDKNGSGFIESDELDELHQRRLVDPKTMSQRLQDGDVRRPPSGRPGAGAGPPGVDEVFERFDGNKDGKLRKEEVPEFAQQFILPADADGDDMVTREELQALRQRQRPDWGGRPAVGAPRPPTGQRAGKPSGGKGRPPGLRPAEGRKQIYNRQEAFLRQDLNGDETVSAREYNGPPKMFKELDADGDSKLSLEEARWMMTFSSIPSGSFMMGSGTGGNDERPVHEVKIDAFQMSTTEVTGEITVSLSDASGMGVRIFIPIPAYEVFGAPGAKFAGKSYILLSPVSGLSHIKVAEHPINIPEHPLNQSWIDYVPDMKRFYVRPGFEDWPAVNVRWYGAYAFAEHYGLSLPTEAEWEYAASGGKQFKWATNDGEISGENANYKCFSGTRSQDEWIGYRITVGSYSPNPFGVFDLGGNVWEWALDWYREDFYQYCVDNNITRNPVNLDGEEPPKNAKGGPAGGFTHDARATRGGSYQYHQATLGTAHRNRNYPFRGNDHWGCRVVLRFSSTVFNGKD